MENTERDRLAREWGLPVNPERRLRKLRAILDSVPAQLAELERTRMDPGSVLEIRRRLPIVEAWVTELESEGGK